MLVFNLFSEIQCVEDISFTCPVQKEGGPHNAHLEIDFLFTLSGDRVSLLTGTFRILRMHISRGTGSKLCNQFCHCSIEGALPNLKGVEKGLFPLYPTVVSLRFFYRNFHGKKINAPPMFLHTGCFCLQKNYQNYMLEVAFTTIAKGGCSIRKTILEKNFFYAVQPSFFSPGLYSFVLSCL